MCIINKVKYKSETFKRTEEFIFVMKIGFYIKLHTDTFQIINPMLKLNFLGITQKSLKILLFES
jgi:hypothetical protein